MPSLKFLMFSLHWLEAFNNVIMSAQGLLTSVLPGWLDWQERFTFDMQEQNLYTAYHEQYGFVYKEAAPFILPVLVSNYSTVTLDNGQYVLLSLQVLFELLWSLPLLEWQHCSCQDPT